MIHEYLGDDEKIEMVLEWAEDHDSFNTDFIISLQDALGQYSELTSAQQQALDNIIDRFRIKKKS